MKIIPIRKILAQRQITEFPAPDLSSKSVRQEPTRIKSPFVRSVRRPGTLPGRIQELQPAWRNRLLVMCMLINFVHQFIRVALQSCFQRVREFMIQQNCFEFLQAIMQFMVERGGL